jgi:hypothetical protein
MFHTYAKIALQATTPLQAILLYANNVQQTHIRQVLDQSIAQLVLDGLILFQEAAIAWQKKVKSKVFNNKLLVCNPDIDFTYYYGSCVNGSREKTYMYVQPTGCDINSEPFLPNITYVPCGKRKGLLC